MAGRFFDDSMALDRALRAKREAAQAAENARIAGDRLQRDREKKGEALSPTIERAYLEAQEKLSDPDYAIQMDDFVKSPDGTSGVYSEQEIADDKAEISRLQAIFDQSDTPDQKVSKKMADVFEWVMLTQSELSDWLGEDVKTVRTSPWDDIKNGVDMYTEWANPQEGSRVLALAVDITFSAAGLTKKLERVKKDIDHDELTQIKYFKDEHGDFMGRRSNVPRVVIGVSPKLVEELASLSLNKENKRLAAHPVQRLIVEQIHEQMLAMLEYARAQGKQNAARAYEQALGIVSSLAEKKKAPVEKGGVELGMHAYDSVTGAIKLKARSLFGATGAVKQP